ncbi:MAG: 1-acyl-sn-glycerol-3-phosphate acyltransferase [Alphaproteobacteria bacterium]
MARYWLRSTIFNLCFYFITALACIVLLPTLLMPRRFFIAIVHGWTWFVFQLEKLILGLTFEVRGVEHIPKHSSFIVAAKHQSAYETLKLHMLFGDPAIILKQELLKIPFWGLYLKKIDPIAIDRSNKETAIASIQQGSIAVKDQNRPIVIFPQGTRVHIDHKTSEKPYRIGVARIQEATNLPIVPMALNTGYFWPRSGWCKHPGRVIFEFLPAINHGMSREEIMQKLELDIEKHSSALLMEAKDQAEDNPPRFGRVLLPLLVIAAILYGAWWFYLAGIVKKEHSLFLTKSEQVEMLAAHNTGEIERSFKEAKVSGFPGPITLNIARETFTSPTFTLSLSDIKAWSWPFPHMPIRVETKTLTFRSFMHPAALEMESFKAQFTPKGTRLELDYAQLSREEFTLDVSGSFSASPEGTLENLDMIVTLRNIDGFLAYLNSLRMLDKQGMMFVRAGLKGFEEDGVVSIPITLQGQNIFAGPFMIAQIP